MTSNTKAILIILGLILLIGIGPVLTIYSLNTLFMLSISVNLQTWLSVAWLSVAWLGTFFIKMRNN